MAYSYHLFVLFFCAAFLAQAQNTPPIGVPVMGLVLDSRAQVRPVIGIPGAANLGPAAGLDSALQGLAIGPNQDYVIALQGDSQDLVVVSMPTGAIGFVLAPKAGPVRVTLSPRGTAALIGRPDGKSGQVWTGLPAHPAVAWNADWSSLQNSPSSLAVSDDGQAVLAAGAAADRVSILLATQDTGSRTLSSVASLGGLAFIPGRTDALVGDAQTNQIQLIQDVTGHASTTVIADATKGIGSPVDVAGSDDGRLIFVANTNPGGVTTVSLDTNAASTIACACSPAFLTRMSSAPVFRLTDSAAGLFWVLDGGANQRIVAIPPDPPATEVQQ